MKKLLLILFAMSAAAAAAQREINHWQFTAMGGGFYFDENLSNSLEGIEEPGFYTLGLRVQKRLGSDFQLGLSFLENRLRDNADFSVRLTNLNLAYNWDNGYFLSQRSVVSPYHLLAAGFRFRGSSDELNFENTRGLLSLENGLKVRVGDNWSTQVGFVVNWNSRNESFEGVFDSGYNYGVVIGVSYHLGSVKTNYKGPVFNAGREFNDGSISFEDLSPNDSNISNGLEDPIDNNVEKREESAQGTTDLIERQNRLIQNQNEFIRMMLYSGNFGDLDSSMVLVNQEVDTNDVAYRSEGDSSELSQSQELYDTQDSLALLRLTRVDSAHVTQWKDAVVEQSNDTVYRIRNADSAKVAAMESRLKQLEEENESFIKQGTEIERMDDRPVDTVFVREGENSEQIDRLERRLNQLEEENKNLKENGKANSQNGEVKNVPSESDRALLEETKRRNDLLEQQVAATQKLAEKSVEPAQVVIDEQRSNGRGGVNLQPGLVVPIGGGGGSKKDNKEILENQKEMEARIDSLIRVISNMRATQTPTVTPTGETNTSRNNVITASIESSDTLATKSDSIPTDTTAADSLKLIEPIRSADSTAVDTINFEEDFDLLPDTLTNPKIEPDLVDSLASQIEDDTVVEETQSIVLENPPIEPSLDYPIAVYFGLNSVNLSSADQTKLKEVADDLANTTQSEIVLEGHTDKSGNASYNEMLSKKRANAVKNYLVENGVAASRITITPLGSKNADQAYNENSRRVDILVK